MIKRYAILCNLLFFAAISCRVWGNGKGSFYATGLTAPSGTWFSVLVNNEYRTGFNKLNQRYYVGKTKAGDVISVQVDGVEICVGG
jgi:hypothetical protein